MSYTLTMEPEVRRGAEEYAARRGMTLEDVINAYLVVIAKRAEDHTAEREVVRHRPKVSDFTRTGASFARAWGRIGVVDGELDLSRRAEQLREIDFA